MLRLSSQCQYNERHFKGKHSSTAAKYLQHGPNNGRHFKASQQGTSSKYFLSIFSRL